MIAPQGLPFLVRQRTIGRPKSTSDGRSRQGRLISAALFKVGLHTAASIIVEFKIRPGGVPRGRIGPVPSRAAARQHPAALTLAVPGHPACLQHRRTPTTPATRSRPSRLPGMGLSGSRAPQGEGGTLED